ncbi:hypothetical protein ASPWEDRAFT_63369 [Aspergillus wentii DTO 134E9]|uniref:DUF3533 domain-containing protein n=1 Tax=Aspergillus wentii DTO 134E9 TaxID=1073089 RepID=A0A1L9R4T4_ASPWE|nr:uncharacterized protein ASPWEDRAFT_63369 [Aspergillus wentii DTO 134E9]KAI9927204.1 hypothetical protein MW887_003588 [Aspergillus wentii]OJJ29930.1 hypothetical protein ASPWEDRAFT_63369 [Aspergillus wentii DTO 134E9]
MSLKPFFIAIIGAAVSLQVLILANMSYLYGSAYHDGSRYSSMKVLYIDYDQGPVGESVMRAYNALKDPSVPTLIQRPQQNYPTQGDIQQAVCRGDYWGAIYATPNASSQLSAALSSPEIAQGYDNSQALGYIWSSARYPAYAQGVYSNLVQITEAAAAVYKQTTGTDVLPLINTSDHSIAQTILDPISASSTDLHPMPQGVRFYYNTVSMVMPIIIQFFFIMALTGITMQNNLFSTLSPKQNTLLRFSISVIYTFIASLVMTGYIWAFREDWHVTAGQFALTWMAIWLTMHIHFLIIDFATAIMPMPFVPYFILTWIILNVTSTIGPFEQSPGFYRLGYVFPAHELYEVLLDIWTHGCNPHLYRALPILFAEWVVGIVLFVAGIRLRMCGVVSQSTGSAAGEKV